MSRVKVKYFKGFNETWYVEVSELYKSNRALGKFRGRQIVTITTIIVDHNTDHVARHLMKIKRLK